MSERIHRPIFIVGCGRSGTTITYDLLAGHPDVGWFSNYNHHFPQFTFLSSLNASYKKPSIRMRVGKIPGFPKPWEGLVQWNHFDPRFASPAAPPLTEVEARCVNLNRVYSYIEEIQKHCKATRFLNKNTRNTIRIRYLNHLFPDAFFIHVLRDGRAVTHSLINVSWWSDLELWWANGKQPKQLEQEGIDRYVIGACMWRLITQRALADKEWIPRSQYLEIRYERLTEDPLSEMQRISNFCGLQWNSKFADHVASFQISNQNYKWKSKICAHQKVTIERECGNLLTSLGYI